MNHSSEHIDRRAVLEQALLKMEHMQSKVDALEGEKREPIAIIGLSCRFPGKADSPEAYWNLLKNGMDAIREVPPDRWDVDAYYDADPDAPGKMCSRLGGFIEEVDKFDASFFGITPVEASKIDPQQRVLLEVSWEALENAALVPQKLIGSQTGVFIGITNNDYARILERMGPNFIDAHHLTGNCLNFAAGRIAYVLGLQGPTMAVDTACSASGVSVHLACQSLRGRECNLALAGGVNLILSPELSISASKAGFLSPDGKCKTFDASANGYVRSEGCGVVVLKRLSDALSDGDHILAVIRGSAVNQDGASSGITVPNKLAQVEVIRQALEKAAVDPNQVGYVETHGTGTPLGDPIEVRALASAYGGSRPPGQPLFLGSAKTNIGHLESAAGIAGLIKVVLSLQHGIIPPNLHLRQLNPAINLGDIPALIPTKPVPWSSGNGPRIAGLSSFGGSGTIVHMIVEEAPGGTNTNSTLQEAHVVLQARDNSDLERRGRTDSSQAESTRPTSHLLTLSARSSEALTSLAHSYQEFLAAKQLDDSVVLKDICFSASLRRSHHDHRLAVVGSSSREFCERMDAFLRGKLNHGYSSGLVLRGQRYGPVFVFSGHGPQWFGMGRELLMEEPLFREAVEHCDEALRNYGDWSLLEELSAEESRSRLNETQFAQAAIFALQVGLAALWRSWGVVPDAVIGHSVGEVAAAYVAGALTFEDAVQVIFQRGRLMQRATGHGKMASIELPVSEIERALSGYGGQLSVGAVNTPSTTVVSGEPSALDDLLQSLQARGISYRLLPVNYAFHSSQMDPLKQELIECLGGITPHPSLIPIYSTVSGDLCDGTAMDVEYWWRNLRKPVLFSGAVDKVLDAGYDLFLEVGAHPVLSPAISQCLDHRNKEGTVLASLRRGQNERATLLTALGGLYTNGYEVDWHKLYTAQSRFVTLPSYPWQRKRFWLEHPSPAGNHQALQSSPKTGISQPFAEQNPSSGASIMELPLTNPTNAKPARKDKILALLIDILHELSGIELTYIKPDVRFIEIGLDSLFLTQASHAFSAKFGVKITIRQLMEDLYTPDRAAAFLAERSAITLEKTPGPEQAPNRRQAPRVEPAASLQQSVTLLPSEPPQVQTDNLPAEMGAISSLERIMREQLRIMNRQLDMLNDFTGEQKPALPIQPSTLPVPPDPSSFVAQFTPHAAVSPPSEQEKGSVEARFKPVTKEPTELTERQRQHLEAFIARYTKRTKESKRQTQIYRQQLADHRSVMGFRQFRKEMIYPIVSVRSAGSKIWDVDGNEYIDFISGFGANLFGHMPPFVQKAIEDQLKLGIEVGPQTPWAGKVANLICKLTGSERVAFCNTGSEAVMAAMRLARVATGRDTIVTFDNDYHGNFDEVLVRRGSGSHPLRSVPVAPGIPQGSVGNMVVLECGSPKSIDILKSLAPQLAAVLIEPIHFRSPERWPTELLQEIRILTEKSSTALIFDELITGFRIHQGGAQAHFGIRADLATYGKVVGGGLPIGIVAGKARFMDGLDGGFWSYGDHSMPEVGITFFDGTFARHPLAMAAAHAVLEHLKKCGPELQQTLNERTTRFVETLRAIAKEMGVPLQIYHTGSIFYLHIPPELPFGSLLFYYLREKGIHAWEHRSWILSTAHTDADLQYVVTAFRESMREMIVAGFLPGQVGTSDSQPDPPRRLPAPPVEGPPLGPPVSTSESAVTVSAPALSVERHPAPMPSATSAAPMKFGLYFFGNYPSPYAPDKYRMLLEAARWGDENGFSAIWVPERHFHAVGGFSPNPAVVAAALARETRQISLRAGSVVLPLHNPIRVAEEWSLVDNLSQGRVGLSVASGWHANDFVFAPDAFEKRRELCEEGIALIRKLWSGQTIPVRGGNGNALNVSLYPLPMQRELPMWLTCTSTSTYEKAGELGTGVLAMLTNHSLDELAEKIALYRRARERYGYDPATGNVTLLIHTFVDQDYGRALTKARGPMREYLRSYLDNSQKRFDARGGEKLDEESTNYLLDRAFEDYLKGKALIGTPQSCISVVEGLRRIGADELGCFVDFGVDTESVLTNLPHLAQLKRLCGNASSPTVPTAEAQPAQVTLSTQDRSFPLHEGQQGLLVLAQMAPQTNRAYMEAMTMEISGPLNVDILKQSIQTVIDRHEALRTSIDPDGEFQTVHDHATLAVPFTDLRSLPEAQRKASLAEQFAEIESRIFDLSQAPVMEARIYRVAEDRHLLVLMFHHLFGNGPSYEVFVKNLSEFYAARLDGQSLELEPPMQLSDYLRWRQRETSGPQFENDRQFWLEQFPDSVPILDLPLDHPRPTAFGYVGARESLILDRRLTTDLRKVSKSLGSSLFVTLFAGFNVLLHRLSGQESLVVGVPFEGEARSLPGGSNLFANTTNVLPLRSRFEAGMKFSEFLSATKSAVYNASEHQSYFFGRLRRDLGLRHDPGRPPIIAALFNIDRSAGFRLIGGNLRFELVIDDVPQASPRDTSKFEISINIVDKGEELQIDCDFSTELFDASTIARWLRGYQTLLQGITANPPETVGKLPLLTEGEQRQLREWNDTAVTYPAGDLCLHQIIEEQVRHTPDQIAVAFGEQQLTYAELNCRANQLAHHLRGLGVGPDSIVGVFLERSLEMVVALLGILKAGGAYLPLDPEYPKDRLAFMLDDADMSVLLTTSKLAVGLLPSQDSTRHAKVFCFDTDLELLEGESDTNPAINTKPENLAYVIYTSGSTGKPKGVPNVHCGIVNRLLWMQDTYRLDETDRVLQKTPYSFDVSVWEFFWPLMTGACLVMARPGGHRDPQSLVDTIVEQKITTMHFVPSMLRVFLDFPGVEQCSSLRQVFCSGEALPIELQEGFFERLGAKLHNLYGPTEASVDVTYWECQRNSGLSTVPIGKPIWNTQIYILDKHLQPVPVGVTGELHIGGTGLARGYLKRPALKAEKFIPDPFSQKPGSRLYKTGDLARFMPDGNIEYLGRMDNQVKIRGLRIELGEVEAVLAGHAAVRQCVVVAREDLPGDVRLVAYFQPDGASMPSVSDLRSYLKEKLPEYMVPSAFVPLETFPLTPNGKIDRKALPASDQHLETGHEFVAPADPVQEKLAAIWSEVLNVPAVGVYDNFFELGGHSLLAMRTVSRIRNLFQVELPLQTIFAHPTVAALAEILAPRQKEEGVSLPRIEPRGPGAPSPLSYAQEGLWFLDHLSPGSPVYNIVDAVPFSGPCDLAAMQRTLNEVVRRHESLRARFPNVNGQPLQIVEPSLDVPLPELDLSSLPPAERPGGWLRLAREEGHKPFDLSQAPLLRATLVHLDPQEHLLVVTIHHMVTDESSMEVLRQELQQIYEAFSQGQPSPLPELAIQYADFAYWQRQGLQQEALTRGIAYWREELAGAPALLELPTDKPRPRLMTFRGSTEMFELPKDLLEAVRVLSLRERATLFMTLEATFMALLHRYTGQADILVGTPISVRTRSETEGLIGNFLNTVVLRGRFSEDLSFRELLGQVRETALRAYAHQQPAFEQIVAELTPQRDMSHMPLFQAMFVLHNPRALSQASQVAGLQQLSTDTSKFDVALEIAETETGFEGLIEYSTDLFEAGTIRRMFGHYRLFLEAFIREPDRRISSVPMLSEGEQRQLREWNDTVVAYPARDLCLHQIIEEQARRTPNHIAVIFEQQQLTYAELNRRANQLAHRLRKLGVGPDVLVGVFAERSVEMVVALLGILKAGGAYVPIDPDYPAERVAFMLQDAGAPVLLTLARLVDRLPQETSLEAKVLRLDEDWEEIASEEVSDPVTSTAPNHLAYMIYTSGSTGTPKGAMNTHRGITNRLLWMQEQYRLTEQDRVIQKTPFSFDVSVWEFFWPLMVGARLVVAAPGGHQDAPYLADLIARQQITVSHFVPSMLAVFLAQPGLERCRSLRHVICSGEALPFSLQEQFFQLLPAQLHNLYGPTEAAVDVTYWECRRDSELQIVPIGRPVANTQIHILDRQQQPVPLGVPGELYIGGVQVARGYHKRPELTAERFVADPFSANGGRLYKTGDLCRRLADGAVEYLGRLDFQVKIRGLRIELGEVEAVLARHAAVRQCVVVAREEVPGDMRLIAYFEPRSESIASVSDLRSYLKETLPEYMIPSAFVAVEKLPLSPNGKVDRKALPAPEGKSIAAAREFVAPGDPVQQSLAAIWSEVLNVDPIGIHDDFFELGGHSLLAMKAVSRIRNLFGVDLPLRTAFESSTVATLAEAILQSSETRQQVAKRAELLVKVSRLSEDEVNAMLNEKAPSIN